ncbi:MAG: hypothetical protein AAFQ51_19070, partial [Pseudomonadota bacterium]
MRRPRLLDISRTVSRTGIPVATGIDRVERAYVAEIVSKGGFGLASLGSVVGLLDADGVGALLADPGALDARGWLQPWRTRARRSQEAMLRRHAIWVGSVAGLTERLAARFPQGFHYINVGHTGLD